MACVCGCGLATTPCHHPSCASPPALTLCPAAPPAAVAAALGHFPWPVYQCVVPLLREVAHEAARRTAVGGMSPPAGARALQAAVASANALNPRIGAELEAEAAGWRAQGRLATGHAIPSEPACDLPSPAFI